VKLFDAAMGLDLEHDHYNSACMIPNPQGFPKDIAAKDFMEGLKLWRQMWLESYEFSMGRARLINPLYEDYDEQIGEVANIAANIPETNLEELVAQLSPPQRKVFDRIVGGSHPRLKDLVNDETLISDRTGKKMAEGTIRSHVSAICEIFDASSRKALFAKFKPLLPPKAKQRHSK
jgi:hypothetical protein